MEFNYKHGLNMAFGISYVALFFLFLPQFVSWEIWWDFNKYGFRFIIGLFIAMFVFAGFMSS